MKLKPSVLILTDWFVPGFKAGGPIQSIKNLVEHLGDEIDFSIITGDCDLNDTTQYPVKEFDEWIGIDKYRVCYTTPQNRSEVISKELAQTHYTAIYLNSLFSKDFTLKPLVISYKLRHLKKVVLAPRGMLGKGALSLKPIKKRLFLFLFKLFRFHVHIQFHSTDSSETKDIQAALGMNIRVNEVYNLPALLKGRKSLEIDAPIRFVFASRISPKKNLDFAIKALSALNDSIELHVYGVIDDPDYWTLCKSVCGQNVNMLYHGALSHKTLIQAISNHHFFILPTRNENFGHSIIESMSLGIPVIISDQTPWTDLDRHVAGRSIPLSNFDAWVDALSMCLKMSQDDYNMMCLNSIDYVNNRINIHEVRMNYKNLFGGTN